MEKEARKLKDSPEKIKFWTIIESTAQEIQSWPSWKKDTTWLDNNYSTNSSQVFIQE